MALNEATILVASRDPKLADVRKKLLENAGFKVHAASDPVTVKRACADYEIRLVMIGYSVAPAEKRRIWLAARENCNVPILELYRSGAPELIDQNVFHHESIAAEDFLDTVRKLTSRPAAQAD